MNLPPLKKDPAFLGMTVTQFLGAFNDNLYKQMLLLIAIDYKQDNNLDGDPYQFIAQLAFAIPFVLLSGFAGFLSDRVSKKKVVVFCKGLEILVMVAAVIAFMTGVVGSKALLVSLVAVLFVTGAQSALFGPSKFGILPEMLRERDLPTANGIIQMTTFLAIILGTAASGFLKQALPNQLWVISAVCVGIAIAGTCSALLIRKTPIANPDMKFSADCLLIEKAAFRFIWSDRSLVITMLVYALFWFAGAVVLPLVNLVCKDQLGYSDQVTSILATCMGIGIAVGCVVCGKISKGRVRFDLVRLACWGLCLSTVLVAAVCVWTPGNARTLQAVLIGGCLLCLGFCAGIFALPPQVFIQARPPESSKGRVIGAMNLITWIGICFASVYYYLFTKLLSEMNLSASWTFVSVGLLFLIVGLAFRLPNPPLHDGNQE